MRFVNLSMNPTLVKLLLDTSKDSKLMILIKRWCINISFDYYKFVIVTLKKLSIIVYYVSIDFDFFFYPSVLKKADSIFK